MVIGRAGEAGAAQPEEVAIAEDVEMGKNDRGDEPPTKQITSGVASASATGERVPAECHRPASTSRTSAQGRLQQDPCGASASKVVRERNGRAQHPRRRTKTWSTAPNVP